MMIATLTLLAGLGAVQAPFTFIEGQVRGDMQPDGNSIVLEGPKELLVIDTGRHPEHTDKIIAIARERNKPITAIVNTHWHLDHAIRLGERELQLHLARHAATEGDVWVDDPASETVFVGDLVVVPLPFFDTGCAEGWRQALAEIDQLHFQTLVPGHGLPMDHAAFSSYRKAFDAFTACAEGSEPAASCVAVWMREGAAFVAMHPDPKYTEAALRYYVDRILRVPAKRTEFCGK